MEHVVLNNGFKIPIIGYGTFPQRDSLVANVPIANACGYPMVDTSDNYLNEEFVGRGLELCQHGMVVVSKFSQPFRTYELEKCFEESERKLGGRIDVYLLHWPFPYLWKEQWRRMESLYLNGRCNAIGVCNFDVGYMQDLLQICKVKPAINQFEHHPLYQQKEIVEMCKKHDIQVMAYSPVARMDKQLHHNEVVRRLAEKYGKTTSQIILRWNIDTGCIPIPASSSEEHILENYDVFNFTLSASEISEINNNEAGHRIRFNPRTRFSAEQKRSFLKLRIKNEVKKLIGKRGMTIIKKIRMKS